MSMLTCESLTANRMAESTAIDALPDAAEENLKRLTAYN
jgi:hypothetical protein